MYSILTRIFALFVTLSVTTLGFATQSYIFSGTTAVGTPAALVTVTVTFDKGGVLSSARVLTLGSRNLDFADAGGGSCTTGATYLAGQSCTTVVRFTPKVPGGRAGAITLTDAASGTLATTYLFGTATGGQAILVPSTIVTTAGSNSFLFGGDGGFAVFAGLKLPTGVVLDGADNLYLADSGDDRIRRVDALSLKISTIAGNGTKPFAGDGGPATSAGLAGPSAIAIDAAGNLYIADTGNNRVRAVNLASGVITTIAGNGAQAYTGDLGAATSASLNAPNGLAVDGRGALYIADTGNNVVRQVNLLTGVITTVAGTGVAGFAGDGLAANLALLTAPWNVAVNSAGLLFIADSGNNRIRSVDSAGVITTIAGTGSTAFGGDGGPATAANFYQPSGLVIDAAGNIYISDTGNDRIRKINGATGVITTIAGQGSQNLNGDSIPATTASLFAPYSLAIGKQGNIYIADSFHNRIRGLNSTAAIIFAGGPIPVGSLSTATVETYENDGNAALNISSITASTNAAVDPATTTCAVSTSVPADQSCAVGVQAAPTVAGNLVVGTVTVASDAANTPAIITVNVKANNPLPTTATVTSNLNPAALGTNVIFTAVVTGTTTPSGRLTFFDGTTSLAVVPLDSQGHALLATSSLALGQHPITVSYAGDLNNLSSVSPVLTEVVVVPTVVTITSDVNPSVATLPVTFTATVKGTAGVAPTGIVTFTDGGTAIGTGSLDANGNAAFQTSTLAGGSHSIQASYAGDTNTAAATSFAIVQVVVSTATGTDLLVSSTSLLVGQPLTLTSVVAGSRGTAPTGTVTFLNGAVTLGSANLDAQGVGVFTFVPAAGTYSITSSYSGDSQYAASVSQAATVVVSYPADFTITANPTTLSIASGKNATITVTFASLHGFADKLSLGCAGMPAFSNCTFSQDTLTLDANATKTIQLTINTFPLNLGELQPGPGGSRLSLALALPGGVLFALLAVFSRNRRRGWQALLLIVITAAGVGILNGCGGSKVATTPAGSYTVLINATGSSSADIRSIPLTLTVTR